MAYAGSVVDTMVREGKHTVDIWWIVLVLFILAAIAVLYAVRRSPKQQPSLEETSPARDFIEERETSRLAWRRTGRTGSETRQRRRIASDERNRATRSGIGCGASARVGRMGGPHDDEAPEQVFGAAGPRTNPG